MTQTKTDIREKQLRERVRLARALARLNGPALGEQEWARMYAQDVEPMRRLLANIVIRRVASVINGNKKIVPEAIIKAQKWLGGKFR